MLREKFPPFILPVKNLTKKLFPSKTFLQHSFFETAFKRLSANLGSYRLTQVHDAET